MTAIIAERSRDILLKDQLDDDEVQQLLAPVGFADYQEAYRRLQRLSTNDEARQVLANSLPHLLMVLSEAANPDNVLVNLGRFTHNVANQGELFNLFASNPHTIEILVTLFAGSQFLTEILLRSPEYFARLLDHHQLTQVKSAAQFDKEARVAIIPLLRLSTETMLIALSRVPVDHSIVIVAGPSAPIASTTTIAANRYSPSLKLAFRIARAFGVSIDDVFQYSQPSDGPESGECQNASNARGSRRQS